MVLNKKLPVNPNDHIDYSNIQLSEICLAGGCFWGVEAYLARVPGVSDAVSGYANGNTSNPSYEDVCHKNTGHAEAVYVKYDPDRISLERLLQHFFRIIDPTQKNRQGNDVGIQYRTGVYYLDESEYATIQRVFIQEQTKYTKPIATEVLKLKNFYVAEEYHLKYLEKNPGGYCHVDFSLLEKRRSIAIDSTLYQRPNAETIRKKLTSLQYSVTQTGSTEKPFHNEYWDQHEKGIYVDIVTGEPLFVSSDKFDSGCGWPSFTKPIHPDVLRYLKDTQLGMIRTEVKSRTGDSHLGHVFEDGPRDLGGLRYCINSASLKFIPLDQMQHCGYGHLLELID